MYARKITAALVALVFCFTVLVSASFAWLVMSRSPEIVGMETTIGANGSLEMALLTGETYFDTSLITSGIGDSAVLGNVTRSNTTWGNIVSLDDVSYGLGKIRMSPARLNVTQNDEGALSVGANYLVTPKQSEDGRFKSSRSNSVATTYNGTDFVYSGGRQDYGVRGIGNVSSISPQDAAVAEARTLVQTYSSSALSVTKNMWAEEGDILFSVYFTRYANGSTSYGASFVDGLRSALEKMLTAVKHLDRTLRYGVIGYAAKSISDSDTFGMINTAVSNTAIPLSAITEAAGIDLPSSLSSRITELENQMKALNEAILLCDSVTSDAVPWDTVQKIAAKILKAEKTYVDDILLSDLPSGYTLGSDALFSAVPGAGPVTTVADYVGEYSAFFSYNSTAVQAEVLSTRSEPYVEELLELLDKEETEDGGESPDEDTAVNEALSDVFGYAIDLAFRSNHSGAKLALQTTPVDRISGEADSGDGMSETIGAGSFLKFTTDAHSVTQTLALMDAMRIGFVDSHNDLLGVAKPGTSSYVIEEDAEDPSKTEIKVPIYLYSFALDSTSGLKLGERLEDATIAPLMRNEVFILTAIVWLDGDYAWNSIANAKEHIGGTLNLQFSSDVPLTPAVNYN